MNPCLLITIYNHGATIGALLEALAPLDLPCLVVDDGSDEETAKILDRLDSACAWVRLERRARNGGRGAALKTGYRLAARLGYTHAVQIDADGQHPAGAVYQEFGLTDSAHDAGDQRMNRLDRDDDIRRCEGGRCE